MTHIVAVTGATGYVGRFVVAELHRRGMTVRALARPESDHNGFQGPIDWITGDLRSRTAVDQLLAGTSALIHLAYEHIPGRYRGGEGSDLPSWLDANLNGSLHLLQAAQHARVAQFIFLSSRAVFSRTLPGRALDESHPTSPDTHYGAYKAAVESFMSSAAHQTGMKTVSLRATGIYGLTWPPSRSKWWPIIQGVLHDGDMSGFTGGGTEVYGGDVARVIGALLTDPASGADIIHLSDLYVTQREVVRIARELTGRPGSLPAEPNAPPANPLVCRRLSELGLTLGGRSTLEAAIGELISAAGTGSLEPHPPTPAP